MVSTLLLMALVSLADCYSWNPHAYNIHRTPPDHTCPNVGNSECREHQERTCVAKTKSCEVILGQFECDKFNDNCQCCAICESPDECTGTFREDCNDDEFIKSDHGTYCKCCHPCDSGDCDGRCVSNGNLCTTDEYADGACDDTGGSCTCCKLCTSDTCDGRCVSGSTSCNAGEYTDGTCSRLSSSCSCCKSCSSGTCDGRCATSSSSCITGEYADGTCDGPASSCTCCKYCSSAVCSGLCVEDDLLCTGDNEYIEGFCAGTGNSCFCCKTCTAIDCPGRCVKDSIFCTDDEFIQGYCDGGSCVCCQTCNSPDPLCADAGGTCVLAGKDCPCGYWPSSDLGCNSGNENCICCVPCTPSSACSGGHNPGRCVTNTVFCNGTDEYISSDGCFSGNSSECSCCKTCTPDQICALEKGVCYNKALQSTCPSGKRESTLGGGCCSDDNCICCVVDECTTSTTCDSDTYNTRCIKNSELCSPDELFYESDDVCDGNDKCYKACYPDETCTSEKGICLTKASGGCYNGLVKSSTGSCCDSSKCDCCVPDTVDLCWTNGPLADGNPVIKPGACGNSIGDYETDDGCEALTCKLCKPDQDCCNRGGRCYTDTCPAGLEKADIGGCRNNQHCVCCVLLGQ